MPDPRGGGPEGHVPPEEAISALKKKQLFFVHVLLKERWGGGHR